jgi:predicted enzyme related to lactoylglutathione lyase
MLHHKNVFSSFSVDDTKKAKEFYGKVLGLKVTDRDGMAELHVGDHSRIMIYPKPNHVPATFTVLNFPVKNVEKTVDDLTAHGVEFEHYEGEIKTDAKGICRSEQGAIAWFKDPAGNILSVMEDKK